MAVDENMVISVCLSIIFLMKDGILAAVWHQPVLEQSNDDRRGQLTTKHKTHTAEVQKKWKKVKRG
jgi:hypothetical protein